MSRRICVWVVSFLSSISLAGIAQAQVPPAPAAAPATIIPPQALGASDETPYAAVIKQFVQEQVAGLVGSDAVATTAARDRLKVAMPRGNSAAYYTALAKDFDAECTAEFAKNPPVGVRLNFAIVAAALADNGQTPDIQPLVLKILNDREPCVILWGIKAARPLMGVLVTSQPAAAVVASPLPAAIVAAVKKCGKSDVSGFATTDAYAALVVRSAPGLTTPQVKALQPPLVKFVLDILEFRVQQHADGLVQSPGAEHDVATWLSGIYPILQPAEQTRMVQLMVNLEVYIGKRSFLYENNKRDLDQLRNTVKYVGNALKVFGGTAVGSQLDWLASVPLAATPKDIVAHTDKLFPTMQLAVHELVQPPAIKDIDPPTSQSTKP